MIAVRDASATDLLRTYLNDHLAGAVLGVGLAKRLLRFYEGSTSEATFEDLLTQLEEDRATLRNIMERLGLPEALPKQVVAAAAERVGRLKLNGQILGRSSLSTMVELEGLSVGIEGKLRLWRSLAEVAASWPAVAELDLDELQRRGEAQLETVEQHRIAATRQALMPDRTPVA